MLLASLAAGQPPESAGFWERAAEIFPAGVDTAIAAVAAVALLVLVDRWLRRRGTGRVVPRFHHQLILLGLTLAVLLAVVLTLENPLREQLLALFGVLLSAAIAFSSTTLIGNAMAGLMLRAQRHFRGGDYVKVGDHFGRVSHRGLLFTEIQNELRDLVTLPNSYLAGCPMTVIRSPATLISAEVSLGYDVPRKRVERLLLEAAEAAGLKEAFVWVLELGDFSVRYRVSGLLEGTRHLLSRQAALRCQVLDALHGGGVEIVSPAFMNQRRLADDRVFIPPPEPEEREAAPAAAPEEVIFDKAEEAASLERLEDLLQQVETKTEELREQLEDETLSARHEEIRRRLEQLDRRRAWLAEQIEQRKEETESEGGS